MKIKNYFTNEKLELDKEISLYVCGPTVYDSPHIGNLRPLITFDIFNRVASLNSKVTFVHNITDIDDKIIRRAKELNVTEAELSLKYENEYMELINSLNVVVPTEMPRVSENIEGMIEFISELIEKDYAYESEGDVYFSVKNLENYGKIANLSLDELISEEESTKKKYDKDFALWKQTNDDGIKFNSPWGQGRPGWHTECAYFIKKYFGSNGIDIHGGGIDLKFPHHINEMAQYFANTGNELSKVWAYVGHLNVDSEKMSKSLNNFIKAKDFIEQHGANVLRMILISTHYTKPVDINDNSIENAQNIIAKVVNAIKKSLVELAMEDIDIEQVEPSAGIIEILSDDLKTTDAISYIMEKIKTVNTNIGNIERKQLIEEIIADLKIMGFKFEFNYNETRNEFKKHKLEMNYVESDQIKEGFVK